MEPSRRTLGPVEAHILFTMAYSPWKTFTLSEAVEALGLPRKQLTQRLAGMVDKGWLIRLERGKFCLVPLDVPSSDYFIGSQMILAAQLVDPYYLSYSTALQYYGFPLQDSPWRYTFYIATTKRKYQREVIIQGQGYQFVTLSEHKFFGCTYVTIDGHPVVMATKEKAIVDSLDLPQYAGGMRHVAAAVRGMKNALNWRIIQEVAIRMNNGAVAKRLGYLMFINGLGPRILRDLKNKESKGCSLLDPTAPPRGRIDTYWGLRINVSLRNNFWGL